MKKIQILIITLVVILVLCCTTFAVLYFATDVLKSDKEMFYRYLGEIDLKNFVNTEFYSEYSNKLENNKYEENTNIAINIEGENIPEPIDKDIIINSKRDLRNNLNFSEISINNENENEFNLNYLRNNDIYGILLKDISEVSNLYIALENNNLKEFAQKMGVDYTDIELSSIQNGVITNEELNEIINRYKNIIIEQIPDECYSKLGKETITVGNNQIEANGYAVTINDSQLSNIFKNILETLKDDEQIYNIMARLNEKLTREQYNQMFDQLIENTEESLQEESENILNIVVYENKKDVVKLYSSYGNIEENDYMDMSIDISSNNPIIEFNIPSSNDVFINLEINKNINTNEQESWSITVKGKQEEEETEVFTININREGSLDSEQIKNEFEFIPGTDIIEDIKIKYVTTTKFNDNLEIDSYDNLDYELINNYSREEIINLFNNLGNIVKEQTQDEYVYLYAILGVADSALEGSIYNKMPIYSIATIGGIINVSLNSSLYSAAKEASEATQEIVEKETQLLQEVEQKTFNSRFVMYEGQQNGSTVRTLIRSIVANNQTNPEHIINYSNISMSSIDNSKTYRVSFEQDEEGYINNVIIVEE